MDINRINQESESDSVNGKEQFDKFVKKLFPQKILEKSIGDRITDKIDKKQK